MPRRRCVGCGRVAPKSELLRLAATGPRRAVVDLAGTLPGRGAYLCRGDAPGRPAAVCLQRATRRGGIARALRRPVALELEGTPATEPVVPGGALAAAPVARFAGDPEFVESMSRRR